VKANLVRREIESPSPDGQAYGQWVGRLYCVDAALRTGSRPTLLLLKLRESGFLVALRLHLER
jgi:hypothetical protein